MTDTAHILLVDDDPHMRQATSRLLEKAGHQVTEAGTGTQSVQLAREQKPDLILLDVVLPDMDGVEVCRRIKDEPALADCFVVLLSGFKTSSDAQASGLEAGADGYIARPISNRELLARVEAMLRVMRVEEALQENKERFQEIYTESPIGIELYDASGDLLTANQACLDIFGVSDVAAVQGFKLFEDPNVSQETKQRLLQGETVQYETAFDFEQVKSQNLYETARSGTIWLDVKITALGVKEQSSPDGYLVHVQDITARKKTEQALQESEARYHDIAAHIPGAVYQFLTDSDGNFDVPYMSEGGEALFERPLVELMDASLLFDDVHPNDLSALQRSIAQATQQMERWTHDFRIVNPDGQVKWLRASSNPRSLPDGSILWNGVILDVTAHKRTEERLARYATQLKRSNQQLEQFAYVISHDLQEPTRMIKGYLDLLERRYGDSWDEEARRYVTRALEGAKRTQKMISALLDLSRIETRGQALELTDAGAVLEHTLEALSWVTKEAEAQVTHDPLPEIMADAAQLSQVFQNLISNAIKFRHKDEPPRIHISAQRAEGAWRFSVADNGIGIAPEQAEYIFQIFRRLHPEQDYAGLGIGLALCRSIVERHGGRIWVESAPGQGSTFYFTVPEGKESRLVQASEQKKRT